MSAPPLPPTVLIVGHCPRCGNLLVIRLASPTPQCANWLCDMTSFLAAEKASTT